MFVCLFKAYSYVLRYGTWPARAVALYVAWDTRVWTSRRRSVRDVLLLMGRVVERRLTLPAGWSCHVTERYVGIPGT